jgi:hypothetical protein
MTGSATEPVAEATRAKLLDAAGEVFARSGITEPLYGIARHLTGEPHCVTGVLLQQRKVLISIL